MCRMRAPTVSVRVPQAAYARLKTNADKYGQRLQYVLGRAVNEYVDRHPHPHRLPSHTLTVSHMALRQAVRVAMNGNDDIPEWLEVDGHDLTARIWAALKGDGDA